MKKIIPWILLILIGSIIGLWTYNMFNNKSYTVRFDSSGGSTVSSRNISKNEAIGTLPTTIKKDYEFIGWYYNDEIINSDTKITKDITLVAKWVKKELEEFIVTFDALGGTKIDPIKVIKGDSIEKIDNPLKDGYKFMGWYYQNKLYDLKTPITKNITIVAKWDKINY